MKRSLILAVGLVVAGCFQPPVRATAAQRAYDNGPYFDDECLCARLDSIIVLLNKLVPADSEVAMQLILVPPSNDPGDGPFTGTTVTVKPQGGSHD